MARTRDRRGGLPARARLQRRGRAGDRRSRGHRADRRRTGRSSTTCATSTASTATRRTSATCSRAWREIRPGLRQQGALRPVPAGPGQAGGQGRRAAAALGQRRILSRRAPQPGEPHRPSAWRMRIKAQWFKPDRPQSPLQTASAMAFIVRVSANMLKRMRDAGFDIDTGPAYFGFVREVLLFLVTGIDRLASAQLSAEERAAFTGALVRRVAEFLEENEADLLGASAGARHRLPRPVHRPVQPAGRTLCRVRLDRRRRPRLRLHALPRQPARTAAAAEGPQLGDRPGDGNRGAGRGRHDRSVRWPTCSPPSRGVPAAKARPENEQSDPPPKRLRRLPLKGAPPADRRSRIRGGRLARPRRRRTQPVRPRRQRDLPPLA